MQHRLFLFLSILFGSSLSVQAEYAIGYLHLKNGEPDKAYHEFRELAEVGYAFYMNMIADMHFRGEGVPADPVLAHVWYSLSAAQGNSEGIRGKKKVEEILSQAQLIQSGKLALQYATLYLEPLVTDWKLE